MNIEGSAMPTIVLSSPASFTRMKFGSRVKMPGTMSAMRKMLKTLSRPFQLRRANE